MPTYEYKCDACGHRFELFQSMKDSSKRKCPSCGKNALERLIGTGAAVLFKGSGFYQTDYRSESYKKSAEADKPASAPAAAESGSAPKPAAAGAEPAAKPAAKPDTPKPAPPATTEKASKASKGNQD